MKTLLAAVTVASLALAAPLAAQAGGHGNGKGHDKGHEMSGQRDNDDAHDQGEREHGAGWSPPGLAKKPGGMPPGQYKKMYRQGQRLPTRYIEQRDYVTNFDTYHLRTPPAGYQWVQVGNQYYLAQTRTGLISEVVSALLR